MLTPVFGEPRQYDGKESHWSFYKDGFEIDAILSDPSISHVPLQLAVFETLRSSPSLLEEYRALKLACDGLPYSEYEQRKSDFFETKVVPNNQ
jgi:hypothetical protein